MRKLFKLGALISCTALFVAGCNNRFVQRKAEIFPESTSNTINLRCVPEWVGTTSVEHIEINTKNKTVTRKVSYEGLQSESPVFDHIFDFKNGDIVNAANSKSAYFVSIDENEIKFGSDFLVLGESLVHEHKDALGIHPITYNRSEDSHTINRISGKYLISGELFKDDLLVYTSESELICTNVENKV